MEPPAWGTLPEGRTHTCFRPFRVQRKRLVPDEWFGRVRSERVRRPHEILLIQNILRSGRWCAPCAAPASGLLPRSPAAAPFRSRTFSLPTAWWPSACRFVFKPAFSPHISPSQDWREMRIGRAGTSVGAASDTTGCNRVCKKLHIRPTRRSRNQAPDDSSSFCRRLHG